MRRAERPIRFLLSSDGADDEVPTILVDLQRLAADGFDIAVADVVDAAGTRLLVEAAGRKFFAAIVDVTSPTSTRQFAADVRANMAPVVALVNASR